MFSTSFLHRTKGFVRLSAIAAVTAGLAIGQSAAAAPQKVTYHGTPVTTAVAGKPFDIKFRVKNIGDTAYSGVQVTFHLPHELTHSKISPANAVADDDTITWTNVPLEAGQSFYPSFTFTVDAGTSLKTKLSIWVEVTGQNMEATSTNFSITTKSASAAKKTALSSADVKSIFTTVYGRAPTASELKYWLGRRTAKPTRTSLLGAVAYHKAQNIKH